MVAPLRVLIIEDSEEDALLLLRRLKQGGYSISDRRVDTADDLRQALRDEAWDVIFCDYSMPRFDAPQALQIFQQSKLDVPFIVVSGKIGEDIAVDMMKLGAHDYLLKNNLARLLPAVRRELNEAGERRERRRVEEERDRIERDLHFSEQRYQSLFDSAGDFIVIHEPDGKIIDANRAACARMGYTKEEILTMDLRDLLTPEEAARLTGRVADLGRSGQAVFESALRARDGSILAVEICSSLIVYPTRMVAFTIARDISRRRTD